MARIEDGGRKVANVSVNNAEKVSTQTKTSVKKDIPAQGPDKGVFTKRAELDQQAQLQRYRLVRQADGGGGGGTQTPEQRARAAAREVQNAYNAHPNVIITTPGNGRDPNEPWAQEAAAQKLREVTENEPPEVVALIIEYSKPTLDLIANELGKTSDQYDGGYGDDKPDFDNVINDLAIVANRAASAPNGNQAVSTIAATIVSQIDPDNVGRFDEALGKAVENGYPELAAEVIKQLQAAGRTGQADDILQNVEDAINQIRGDLTGAVEDAAKYSEELGWLMTQWQPLMSEDQLTDAINAYKAENPEYVEALNKIDNTSVAALRALNAFQNTENNFSGLGHADDVSGALKHLFGDKKAQAGIAQSQRATEEIANLLDMAEHNPDANNILDGVVSVAGSIDDGEFLTKEIFNKVFDITINRTIDATTATQIDPNTGQIRVDDFGRVENATAQLDRLRTYADKLGYSSQELTNVFNQLDRVARSTTEGQARTRLNSLRTSLETLGKSNPDLFGEGNRLATKIETYGVFLGAIGAASSINGAISERDALSIVGALVDTSDVAVAALQTRIAKNLLQNQPWFTKLPLGAAGKALGGVGLLIDGINIVKNIKEGNYVDAGLGGVGLAGGTMAILGTTAAVTGVGLFLVGGAIIGSLIYGGVKEANKHETDGARAFLQGAGINPDLANQLINNDSDGRSAAPVFTEVAKRLGVEPQEMFEFLSALTPDQASRLIGIAHGIDPDENGVFPDYVVDITRVYPNETVTLSAPNDVYDLINWMRQNGYNLPGE